jgi:NNP family nitrate/nitrite transporter-like MFS transporter
MQLVAPLVIFLPMFTFLGVEGVPQDDGSTLWLANAAWIWARCCCWPPLRPSLA